MSRIGFIGTGHIAELMERFLVARGHEIVATRRNADVSAWLAEELGVTVDEPLGILELMATGADWLAQETCDAEAA